MLNYNKKFKWRVLPIVTRDLISSIANKSMPVVFTNTTACLELRISPILSTYNITCYDSNRTRFVSCARHLSLCCSHEPLQEVHRFLGPLKLSGLVSALCLWVREENVRSSITDIA